MGIKKYFMTGVEIAILVLLLGGGASLGLKNHKNNKDLKENAKLNEEQAKKIDELQGKLVELNKEKDKLSDEYIEKEEKLKKEVATGFSIAYEQAKDIVDENATPFTEQHEETLKGYVQVFGYEPIAKLIKWQADEIKRQQEYTKQLLDEQQKIKQQLHDAKVDFSAQLDASKKETEAHKLTATKLESEVASFLKENGTLNKIVEWLAIGVAIYFFISLGGVGLLMRTASKAKQDYRDTKRAIKTFTQVNDDGNDTMEAIVRSSNIDLDKD